MSAKRKRNNNIDVLRQAINSRFIPSDQSKLSEFSLNDSGDSVEQQTRTIIGKNVDYLCCQFDEKTDTLFPYFNDVEGLKSISDYVVFAQRGDDFFAFIIEMKKSSHSPQKQVRLTKIFVEFLLNRIKGAGLSIDSDGCKIRLIGIKDNYSRHLSRYRTKIADDYRYDSEGYFLLDDAKCLRINDLMNLPCVELS